MLTIPANASETSSVQADYNPTFPILRAVLELELARMTVSRGCRWTVGIEIVIVSICMLVLSMHP